MRAGELTDVTPPDIESGERARDSIRKDGARDSIRKDANSLWSPRRKAGGRPPLLPSSASALFQRNRATSCHAFISPSNETPTASMRPLWRRLSALPASTKRPEVRLVRRDEPFNQSSGRIYMRRTGSGVNTARDFFNTAISTPTAVLFALIISLYTLVIIVFAVLYLAVDGPDKACGLAPQGESPSFYNVFAFSLETFTTIGYGVPYDTGNFFRGGRNGACIGVLVTATTHSNSVRAEQSELVRARPSASRARFVAALDRCSCTSRRCRSSA